MKILAISLQNINSLKSEKAIEINFRDPNFKEVGLYAITGPTGAGKTTLLDAITIAMYHRVPRFKGTQRGLNQVISYGATEAFSRLHFEEKNKEYEVFWSMSLVTKTGKKRTNPEEKVWVKDLTKGEILEEKKSLVSKCIEQITSLNYDQFLRSVLLAQGEFSAFLSAKGPEKAKLLEQITGEDIYKKIGLEVFERRKEAIRDLELAQAGLSNENLLSDEELKIKQDEIELLQSKMNDMVLHIKTLEQQKQWFENQTDFLEDEKKLKVRKEELQASKIQNKSLLVGLEKDELARPFEGSIQRLDLHNKQKSTLEQNIHDLENVISARQVKVESFKKEQQKAEKTKQQVLENDAIWQPKLRVLQALEQEIQTKNKSLEQVNRKITQLEKDKKELGTKQEKAKQSITNLSLKSVPIQEYLTAYSWIAEQKDHLSGWKSDYKTLLDKYKRKKEVEKKVEKVLEEKKEIEERIKKAVLKQKSTKEELESQQKYVHELQKKVQRLRDEKLNVKNEKSLKLLSSLETLASNAKDFEQKNKSVNLAKAKILENKACLAQCEKDLEEVQKKEAEASQSKKDQEMIVEQRKLIKNYEREREALKKGEPCVVCGATEHPLVASYNPKSVSSAEEELSKRTALWNELTKKMVDLQTQQNGWSKQISTRNENVQQMEQELRALIQKSEGLHAEYKLEDLPKIETKISEIKEFLKNLKFKISTLETQEKKLEDLQNKLQIVVDLHKDIKAKKQQDRALVAEKEQQIETLKIELKRSTEEIENEKITLETALDKLVLKRDAGEIIRVYLDRLTNIVEQYEKKQEEFRLLEKEIEKLEAEEKSCLEQNKLFDKEYKEWTDKKEKESDDLKKVRQDREEVLPFSKALDEKRNELESEKKNAEEIYESVKNSLDQLITQEDKDKAQVRSKKEDLKHVLSDIEKENTKVFNQLTTSSFDNLSDIKLSLLTEEQRKNHQNIADEIQHEQASLTALLKKNQEDLEFLKQQKTFEFNEKEVLEKIEKVKQDQEKAITQKATLSKEIHIHDKTVTLNKEKNIEIDKKKKHVEKWRTLYQLIGNSKEALNIYVQKLTLKNLINLANIHLQKLSKRYTLQLTEGEELNFKLTDHFQADQTRYVDTSSGGEKFIISLALAIGMSDLSSNNVKIESLFIDEGFGTLDAESLDTVMATLENLQGQGKKIGVISHVESLKERIATQIQIRKKGGGVSEVALVF